MEKSEESLETSAHPKIVPEISASEDTEDELYSAVWGNLLFFLVGWIFPIEVLDPDLQLDPVFHGFLSISYVLFDALFLYVPLINEDIKCVTVDNRLKIAALVLRSFSDLRYLVRIFCLIQKGRQDSLPLTKIAKSIALEILSILPIPQVVVLVFLPNMRGSNSLKIMKFLNSLILLQYLLRAYQIYPLYTAMNKNLFYRKNSNKLEEKGILILFNIFAFLLASHVLGAFWYFFSILREIDCWGHASKFEYGCIFSTSCNRGTLANATLINKHCPINPADASVFDFGIFLYALQSGMQESTNFPQKFFQCCSWGLRNLSSFASNLNSSTYGWENLFVVLISISGLILFMYLLGHVQTFMLKAPTSMRENIKETIEPKIENMISEYGLPEEMKSKMMRVVKAELREDRDLVLENIISILSSKLTKDIDDSAKSLAIEIKCSIFMQKLHKVDRLKGKCEEVLQKICEKLEPMVYSTGSYIIRQGEPLDKMFFRTKGILLSYATTYGGSNDALGTTTIQLKKEKDDLYGEDLITWAEEGPNCEMSNLQISMVTTKCYNEVEVFTLSATDLQLIISEYPSEFNLDRTLIVAVDNGIGN